MNCKICSEKMDFFAKGKILNKYEAAYFICRHCEFIQTEEPYWLDEAYIEPINISDTGMLGRNIHFSKVTSAMIYFLFNKNAKFLDYAGGYGIFTRLMNDIGFDYYWHDPYTENLFAKGLEYSDDMHNIELATAFECIEHFPDPLGQIGDMIKISKNILFSTDLIPEHKPLPGDWWYYGLDHGQHISFYTKKTLEYCSKFFGLNLLSSGTLHMFTDRPINKTAFFLLSKLHKYGIAQYINFKMQSKVRSPGTKS